MFFKFNSQLNPHLINFFTFCLMFLCCRTWCIEFFGDIVPHCLHRSRVARIFVGRVAKYRREFDYLDQSGLVDLRSFWCGTWHCHEIWSRRLLFPFFFKRIEWENKNLRTARWLRTMTSCGQLNVERNKRSVVSDTRQSFARLGLFLLQSSVWSKRERRIRVFINSSISVASFIRNLFQKHLKRITRVLQELH